MPEARQCNCQELSSEALAILLDIDADHIKLILGEATEEKKGEICQKWKDYHKHGIEMTKELDELFANLCQQHKGLCPQIPKTRISSLGFMELEIPVAMAVEALIKENPWSSGFHSALNQKWTIVFRGKISDRAVKAAEAAGLEVSYREAPVGSGQILTDVSLPGVAASEIERATEAFNKFAELYGKTPSILKKTSNPRDIHKAISFNPDLIPKAEAGKVAPVIPEVTEKETKHGFLQLNEMEYEEALKSGRYPEPTRYEKLTGYYTEPHEPGWKGLSLAEMFPTKYKDLLERGVPDKLSPLEVKTVIEEKRIPYGRGVELDIPKAESDMSRVTKSKAEEIEKWKAIFAKQSISISENELDRFLIDYARISDPTIRVPDWEVAHIARSLNKKITETKSRFQKGTIEVESVEAILDDFKRIRPYLEDETRAMQVMGIDMLVGAAHRVDTNILPLIFNKGVTAIERQPFITKVNKTLDFLASPKVNAFLKPEITSEATPIAIEVAPSTEQLPTRPKYRLIVGEQTRARTDVPTADIAKILREVPDVKDTSEINYWVDIPGGKVYVEGWSDKCIAGWGYPQRSEGEYAYETFFEVGGRLSPKIIERKARESGLELMEGGFIGTPEHKKLFGITYGVYKEKKAS